MVVAIHEDQQAGVPLGAVDNRRRARQQRILQQAASSAPDVAACVDVGAPPGAAVFFLGPFCHGKALCGVCWAFLCMHRMCRGMEKGAANAALGSARVSLDSLVTAYFYDHYVEVRSRHNVQYR